MSKHRIPHWCNPVSYFNRPYFRFIQTTLGVVILLVLSSFAELGHSGERPCSSIEAECVVVSIVYGISSQQANSESNSEPTDPIQLAEERERYRCGRDRVDVITLKAQYIANPIDPVVVSAFKSTDGENVSVMTRSKTTGESDCTYDNDLTRFKHTLTLFESTDGIIRIKLGDVAPRSALDVSLRNKWLLQKGDRVQLTYSRPVPPKARIRGADWDTYGITKVRVIEPPSPSIGKPRPSSSACPTDLNGDLVTDINDLTALMNNWGRCRTSSSKSCLGDFDGNYVVDIADQVELLNRWGKCDSKGSSF